MKLMAISDIHGHIDEIEARWKPCDACIIAGDIVPMRHGYHDFDFAVPWWNKDLREFCERHKKTQFLVMPGNAELFLDDEVNELLIAERRLETWKICELARDCWAW